MGTQKQTYQVFDTTLNRAVPFTYSGTADIHGIQTYIFTENVSPTKVTSVTVPGAFFHLQAKTVTLPEMYQIHLVYWVDPQTGALLNVNENEKVTLQNPATGGTVAVLFDGDLVATPATVTDGGQPGLQRPHRALAAQHDHPDRGRDRRRPGPDRRGSSCSSASPGRTTDAQRSSSRAASSR